MLRCTLGCNARWVTANTMGYITKLWVRKSADKWGTQGHSSQAVASRGRWCVRNAAIDLSGSVIDHRGFSVLIRSMFSFVQPKSGINTFSILLGFCCDLNVSKEILHISNEPAN